MRVQPFRCKRGLVMTERHLTQQRPVQSKRNRIMTYFGMQEAALSAHDPRLPKLNQRKRSSQARRAVWPVRKVLQCGLARGEFRFWGKVVEMKWFDYRSMQNSISRAIKFPYSLCREWEGLYGGFSFVIAPDQTPFPDSPYPPPCLKAPGRVLVSL